MAGIFDKIIIDKIFKNKRTGQYSIVLPKKKLKMIPKKIELICWR